MKTPPLKSSLTRFLVVAILLLTTIIQPFLTPTASAAQITVRSLTLQANGTDGGSWPGDPQWVGAPADAYSNHFFQFSVPGSTTLGSIRLQYCTTAALTCTAPTGLDLSTTTLGNETGATGFTLNDVTANEIYLGRTPAALGAGTQALTYRIDHANNPDATNTTFFVRISTFTSNNITTGLTDEGTVAASTAEAIILKGIMPESLIFCTGANIDTNPAGGVGVAPNGSVPDCSTATSGVITFAPELFSPTSTSTATSQMAASTNAGTGYVITANAGLGLVSGGNTITGIPSPGAASAIATAQFGLNLVANTAPIAFGVNIDDPSDNLLLRGMPQPDYNTTNIYTYVDGAAVAKSDHLAAGYAANPLPTNAQIYTASYIVNVPGSQAAGNYAATMTYICTPTF